jgi:hypothetical protein
MFLFFCNNWDRNGLVPGQLSADIEFSDLVVSAFTYNSDL